MVLFILFILTSLGAIITKKMTFRLQEEENYQPLCRVVLVEQTLYILVLICNSALCILFIYLSVQFSTPLTEEQDKFFLLAQSGNLKNVGSRIRETNKRNIFNAAAEFDIE